MTTPAKLVGWLLRRAIATASSRSCRHPGRPSHHRATLRHANATASGDPNPKPAPLAGSPAARSTTVCDHRKISPNSPASDQLDAGEFGEILRWSQTVVDLAAGDPAKGAGFGFGSPLAVALAWRSVARWWLGRPGWRQDLDDAVAMARRSNHPTSFAGVVIWGYGWAIHFGVLRSDDSAL